MNLWDLIPWKMEHKMGCEMEYFIDWIFSGAPCGGLLYPGPGNLYGMPAGRTQGAVLSAGFQPAYPEVSTTYNLELISKVWSDLCIAWVWQVRNQILQVKSVLNCCLYSHLFILIIYCPGKSKQTTKFHRSSILTVVFLDVSFPLLSFFGPLVGWNLVPHRPAKHVRCSHPCTFVGVLPPASKVWL